MDVLSGGFKMDIKVNDISTPNYYQIHYRRGVRHYYIILETLSYGKYLLRQILILDPKKPAIIDRTFDDSTISIVKEDIVGFTKPENIITFKDLLLDYDGDDDKWNMITSQGG